MKIFIAILSILNFSIISINAQTNIDFESNETGAGFSWTVFENSDNPPLELINNPSPDAVNASATVAKFTARQDGAPFAGVESAHGDIGPFSLSTGNSTIKIMVYKTTISDVGVKFAISNGGAQPEIKVANTVINEWEELSFDFSGNIGKFESIDIDQIIIFPDFADRAQENIILFDNITFSAQEFPEGPPTAAPTPTAEAIDVISIFSDAYENIDGVNYNPTSGQSTIFSQVSIEGNQTLKYENLDFQITDFGQSVDLSSSEFIHVDFFTSDAESLSISLFSQGANENAFPLEISINEWVSMDIPLSFWENEVNLSALTQLKFLGNGTVYLDNIYFVGGESAGGINPGGLNAPITFENDGFGTDYTWNVFENDANPPLEIIDNPDPSGINTSSTVAKFTALQNGASFAGVESAHGDLGLLTLDESNSLIKIMVYKSTISNVGVKFAINNGGAQPEILVPNTLINQWEELSFDFSGNIGKVESIDIDQIIIFPDFTERNQDNIVYFDNITFSSSTSGETPKLEQTISFGAIPDKKLDDADFNISATASSDLPVTFSSQNNKVSISGNTVSINTAGRAIIFANQAGNENYMHAPTVSQSFCIEPAKPQITANTQNESVVLSSSSSVGNQWYFNGEPIEGEQSQTLLLAELGDYSVQVTIDDCKSELAESYTYMVTASHPFIAADISVYPNPTKDLLQINLERQEKPIIQLFDLTGALLLINPEINNSGYQIKLNQLKSGIYILSIQQNTKNQKIRVIKE